MVCRAVVGLSAMVLFSATAKLIIGLVQPASTELIVANSLSRCISPHAHMEEIKPAKLIQTCNFISMHSVSAYTLLCARIDMFICVCVYTCHAPFLP